MLPFPITPRPITTLKAAPARRYTHAAVHGRHSRAGGRLAAVHASISHHPTPNESAENGASTYTHTAVHGKHACAGDPVGARSNAAGMPGAHMRPRCPWPGGKGAARQGRIYRLQAGAKAYHRRQYRGDVRRPCVPGAVLKEALRKRPRCAMQPGRPWRRTPGNRPLRHGQGRPRAARGGRPPLPARRACGNRRPALCL